MFLDVVELGKTMDNKYNCIELDLTYVPHKYKLYIVQILCKHLYKFQKYTSVTDKLTIYLKAPKDSTTLLRKIASQITITNFVRDFQNEPANVITPDTFCKYVKQVFKKTQGVKIEVMDDARLKKEGLNLVHDMGKASVNKSRFLIMKYKSENATKKICIVGKGVTFDAGGMNLKPGKFMSREMKSDKSGGCIAVGIIKYFANHKIPCDLVVLIPLIENTISDDTVHPGDIIKSYNGKTVEVVDTDAEGRLILADAMAYSQQYKPDYIIDVATMTGWTDQLHCDHVASYFTTNKKVHDLIATIGESMGERVIGLPMWTDYTRFTRSQVADFKNYDFTGCSAPSGFMAAMFLYNFVPADLKNKWVHIDVSNNFTGSVSNGNSFLLCLQLVGALGSTYHLL